jgi:HK97 family phage prohead protease
MSKAAGQNGQPPRENIVRAIRPGGVEVRAGEDGGMPTLSGHFAVFNTWTEINSMWEGNFLERIAPGAFKKTFAENLGGMRALFQHGQDPQVGDKPLGPIDVLHEDRTGAYYEVPLLDTTYNRDILPGLEAGLYGASFRFRVMREQLVEKPDPSAYNPRGLPERTVQEAQVMEFGPVTFPAYAEATAGVRSLTDEMIVARFASNPDRLIAILTSALRDSPLGYTQPASDPTAGTEDDGASDGAEKDDTDVEKDTKVTSEAGRSGEAPSTPDADGSVTSGTSAAPLYGMRKETPSWRL